jgi:uncharacterized damage-inducible protein DinB
MRRFTGEGEHPLRLDAIMFDDLDSLEAARRDMDARILVYIDTLPEAEIEKQFDYKTTKGEAQRFLLRDLLIHFFNHQTHHRGQAHAILTMLGVPEPRPLDFLGLMRHELAGGAG